MISDHITDFAVPRNGLNQILVSLKNKRSSFEILAVFRPDIVTLKQWVSTYNSVGVSGFR